VNIVLELVTVQTEAFPKVTPCHYGENLI